MNYIISAIIGYLLGSFPTAYVLMKKFKGLDITKNGSKNVGALNSYEVSESFLLGLLVFLVDAFKGFFSVYLVQQIIGTEFLFSATALFFSVSAHCYSPWIKFKGGRGLATAFGGALLFAYAVPIIWAFFWIIAYIFRKNIHFGNIAATILTGAIGLTNSDILNKYTKSAASSDWIFGVSVALVMLIIMTRHIEPLKEWFFSQRRNIKGNENEKL